MACAATTFVPARWQHNDPQETARERRDNTKKTEHAHASKWTRHGYQSQAVGQLRRTLFVREAEGQLRIEFGIGISLGQYSIIAKPTRNPSPQEKASKGDVEALYKSVRRNADTADSTAFQKRF